MYNCDSKLIKLVVDDTLKAVIGLLVGSAIFVWTYVNFIPLEYILMWSVAQVVFILLRFYNSKVLLKYIQNNDSKKIKVQVFILSILIIYSSLVWSVGAVLGAMYAPSPYEFVLFIIIMGVITAAMISLTPIINIFLVYFFIMIITQFSIMVYFGAHAHITVIALLIVYVPVVILLSKSVYNNHSNAIIGQRELEAHNDELKELSITDSLTKVYNRRHFFEAAQTLVSIAKREKSDISFLMIDIDYFKNVNDTYGHQVGDYVLVRLSQEIQSMVRDSDIFARIGGEEFALLLHGTSLDGAKIIAEKVRLKVEELEFEDNYIPFDLTVSVGCSSLNETVTTLDELYQDADKKLYVAKELGRNRVQ
ncbi:MAG: hypothetical protein DRG78_17775 [Epsilonproteobacteria bacterium]|nr:MAG: hypothetical protein DRG78_17775 [Campylobacterota bacterium]